MSRKLSRRQMLSTAGASVTALLASDSLGARSQNAGQSRGGANAPGRAEFWGPGPDKNLSRTLKPGATRVRLTGPLNLGGGRGQPTPAAGDDIGAAVKALHDRGFTAVFASGNYWIAASEAMVNEFRAATKQFDIDVFELGGYRNILHPDESSRQENLKRIAQCLEAAERIGCRMVGTITGSRNPEGNQYADNYAVHPDNWTLETWKMTVAGIKQILKDTAGLKAVLGMEAQVTTNLDGPIAHRNLMDDVADPRCKVNLDPTNMIHLHNHFHTTQLLNQCFDMLGEDIMGCHAKDTYILPHSQTVHVQEVCPGRGRMDYETYLTRLSQMKWPRSLHVEHIPLDQYPEAWAYIGKVAAKVGVKVDTPRA